MKQTKEELIKNLKLQKTTQRQMLNVLQKQCDKEENEGGRLLIQWYREEYL